MPNPLFDVKTIFTNDHVVNFIQQPQQSVMVIQDEQKRIGVLPQVQKEVLAEHQFELIALLPPLLEKHLGNQAFLAQHNLRYPYVVGEMANGVATANMVIAAARAGMFGFFGAAGLMPAEIEKNILSIRRALGEASNWGSNLIYMPQEPELEAQIVDLYLRLNVHALSASAYMSLSPHVVRFAATGLTVNDEGKIVRKNTVIAKLSRPEVAQQFMSPPPQTILDQLVAQGKLSAAEVKLASQISVASSVTVESDSGGHTDNRPLSGLFSTIHKLALELTKKFNYQEPIFVGAAGGLGTPESVAAAFALGADYVLTGSINAAAVESGFSDDAKQMLAKAEIVDVMMAPAADMFELGVKLQILKRGTLFGMRAAKLYELYRNYESLAVIPPAEKIKLEQQIFRDNLENIWQSTRQFFLHRDPKQIERAERDPKHKMALVFRWYLGQSTRWAITGEVSRRVDYQVWAGPAMGAFNTWVAGTFLSELAARSVFQIGRNLLFGATVITRAQQLRNLGVAVPSSAFFFSPQKFNEEVDEHWQNSYANEYE